MTAQAGKLIRRAAISLFVTGRSRRSERLRGFLMHSAKSRGRRPEA